MDGTFGFTYCGDLGVGIGVFRVNGCELIGADLAGGRYKGRITEDQVTGELDLTFDMTVPVGVFLVQGTSPQDVPYIKTANVKVPAGFGDGTPFEVYVPPGTVTLMVKRISDEFAPYADGVRIEIQPLGRT